MAQRLADLERRRSALLAERARLLGIPAAREDLEEAGAEEAGAFGTPSGVGSRAEAVRAGAGVLSQALQRERAGVPWWRGLRREDLPVATDVEPVQAQLERLGLLRQAPFRFVPTEMMFPGATPHLQTEFGGTVGFTGAPEAAQLGELVTEGERLTDEEIRRILEHLGMEEERVEGPGVIARAQSRRR